MSRNGTVRRLRRRQRGCPAMSHQHTIINETPCETTESWPGRPRLFVCTTAPPPTAQRVKPGASTQGAHVNRAVPRGARPGSGARRCGPRQRFVEIAQEPETTEDRTAHPWRKSSKCWHDRLLPPPSASDCLHCNSRTLRTPRNDCHSAHTNNVVVGTCYKRVRSSVFWCRFHQSDPRRTRRSRLFV
jgi:hypothetical protein